MNKKLPKQIACKEIVKIPGTKYVVLPDDTVARLLTPRTVHGKTYFNLWVNKGYETIQVDKLRSVDFTEGDSDSSCGCDTNSQK